MGTTIEGARTQAEDSNGLDSCDFLTIKPLQVENFGLK
jgi:hypothetical protein